MKDPWPDGHYAEEDLYSKMQGFARRDWLNGLCVQIDAKHTLIIRDLDTSACM